MSQTLISHPDSSRNWLLDADSAHGISETKVQSAGCSAFPLVSVSVRLDKCLLRITLGELMEGRAAGPLVISGDYLL